MANQPVGVHGIYSAQVARGADLARFCGRQIAVTVNPQVAETLLGPARKAVAALGEELGREIEIRARPGQHQEQFEVTALDQGPPVPLELAWLREIPKDELPAGEAGPPPEEEAEAAEPPIPEAGPLPEAEAEGSEPRAAEAAPAIHAADSAAPVALAPADEERGAMPEMLDADGERPILRRSEKPEES